MEVINRKQYSERGHRHPIEIVHVASKLSCVSSNSYFNQITGIDICKNNFNTFIKSRIGYLDALRKLGDNWISGESKQPTEESLKTSKSILNNLNWWYLSDGCHSYIHPQIIMSPTPIGGIAMEIIVSKNVKALITVLDSNIDLEVENNGYYSEQDTDSNNINVSLTGLYTNAYRGQSYTRWASTL